MKLAALARDHGVGDADVVPAEFGLGAGLVANGAAWVLLDRDAARGLGPALAWALRRPNHEGVTELHVLAEEATGLLARRAAAFRLPVHVWRLDDRTLVPAIAEPLVPAVGVAADGIEWAMLRALIVEAGAQPVVEHGVLSGEVDGLEVCRVVTDAESGATRLEVGIGAHDREAFQLLHGDRPTVEALADVVQFVAEQRRPGARPHPLNLLAKERALRAALVADPSIIGATDVRIAAPPVPRVNVKDAVPCVAIATLAGIDVTVVCSSGVDLDVVPFATDAQLVCGTSESIVVVPHRDLLPVQELVAAAASAPVRMVGVDTYAVDAARTAAP